jgi:ABC-type glutathione transport system ATPase component
LASFAVAYALHDLLAPNFPRTLAFVAPETAVTFAVMLVGGVRASLMAVWHALRTPARGAEVAVVDIHNVSQTFGHGALAVQALQATSLAIEAGELVALLGPSGSGKSTLLLAISLIQPPTTGRIVIAGQTLYDDGSTGVDVRAFRRSQIGFIFQQHNLIPFLTALENVALMLQINGVRRRAAARGHRPGAGQ